MDVSEGIASPLRKRLTSLSYVATRLLGVRDRISHHFYLTMLAVINLKSTQVPLKERGYFLAVLSLLTLQITFEVNRTVPAVWFS